jgi:hypothetical protein
VPNEGIDEVKDADSTKLFRRSHVIPQSVIFVCAPYHGWYSPFYCLKLSDAPTILGANQLSSGGGPMGYYGKIDPGVQKPAAI